MTGKRGVRGMKRGNDFLEPAAGSFLKFCRREQPAVAVENLDRVHARFDLQLQMGNDGGGEFFDQSK